MEMAEKKDAGASNDSVPVPLARRPVKKPVRKAPIRTGPSKERSRVVKTPARPQRSRPSQTAAVASKDSPIIEEQSYSEIVDHYSRTKAAPSHRDMKDRAHYLENLSEFDSEFDTTVLDPEGA